MKLSDKQSEFATAIAELIMWANRLKDSSAWEVDE